MYGDIIFPNLGITFSDVGKAVTVFGFRIAYYGIVITLAMAVGYFVILSAAKATGQNQDDYVDYFIFGVLFGVIGARVYYVAFAFDYYRDNLLSIFNLRQGGLAIYGGIIFGTLAVFLTCKHKKTSFLTVADTAILAVPIAQSIGRWGNFFNREAFGQYSDGLFAMLLPIDAIRSMDDVTDEMLANLVTIDGVDYISVHPTFLYESIWNLCLFLIMLFIYRYFYKHGNKPFAGAIFLLYLFGYGLGRFWIEGLRTDQLLIPGTLLPVSRLLAAALVLVSLILGFVGVRRSRR